MSKLSRLSKDYRQNASKLHIAVGEMLKQSVFNNCRIYQEYPVNKISPYFDSGKEKFDWIVLDFQVVIEAHGEQHFKPVCFGGISKEEAEDKFKSQQARDLSKQLAALRAGWKYVMFRYDEPITTEALYAKINNSENIELPKEPSLPGHNREKSSYDQKLAKARDYRKSWNRKRSEAHREYKRLQKLDAEES